MLSADAEALRIAYAERSANAQRMQSGEYASGFIFIWNDMALVISKISKGVSVSYKNDFT